MIDNKLIGEFREYIKKSEWRNAKTYESFAPHEYIVNETCEIKKDKFRCYGNCDECIKEREEFKKWLKFIKDNGERVSFGRRQYIMFCLDKHQYWSMDEDIENEILLNRAIINDPRCKIKTFWLDRR